MWSWVSMSQPEVAECGLTTGLGWAGSRPQGQLDKKTLSPQGAALAGASCHVPWGWEWAQHCRPRQLPSPRTGPTA